MSCLASILFVFSCVLTLTPEELLQAKRDNLPVMSIFARETGSPAFAWLAQIIAVVAITSSFFGHYMGTAEGVKGLTVKIMDHARPGTELGPKTLDIIAAVFITLTVWAVAYVNVSVMGLIEALVAPILAIILFIMPVIAVRTVPKLEKYRSPADLFTFFMGLVTIIGFVIANFVL